MLIMLFWLVFNQPEAGTKVTAWFGSGKLMFIKKANKVLLMMLEERTRVTLQKF